MNGEKTSLGPVEGAVVAALRASVDGEIEALVAVSAVAREYRLPRRRVRHQLDRFVDLGIVERGALDVLGALEVGESIRIPTLVGGEAVYRVRDRVALAAYADGEHVDRTSPA